MNNQNEIDIINQLLVDGYEEEIIERAMQANRGKALEEIKAYIKKLNAIPRRESPKKKIDGLSEKELETKRRIEEVEREKKERERIEEEAYKAYIKNKVDEERRLRESEITKIPDLKKLITHKPSVVAQPHECKIKIRHENGPVDILVFNRTDPVSVLFEKLEEYYKGKNFTIYDVNFVDLERSDKSFNELGYVPSKTLNARRA